jgi:hypothetical protein
VDDAGIEDAVRRWFQNKYKLPGDHAAFTGRPLGVHLTAWFEDLWVELRDLQRRLEADPTIEGHGALRERVSVLQRVLGEEPELVGGGDILGAFWNWQAEQGVVPDLDMSPQDPRVLEWARSRSRSGR